MSAQSFVIEILALFGGTAGTLLTLILADTLKTGVRRRRSVTNTGNVDLERRTAAA